MKNHVALYVAVELGQGADAGPVEFLGTAATQWPYGAGAPTIGFVQTQPLPDLQPLRELLNTASEIIAIHYPDGEHGPRNCWYKDGIEKAWECLRALENYEA